MPLSVSMKTLLPQMRSRISSRETTLAAALSQQEQEFEWDSFEAVYLSLAA